MTEAATSAKWKNRTKKARNADNPYAVYRGAGGFTYKVLKTYSDKGPTTDPYARVFLATSSPYTFGEDEYGDGYIKDTIESRYGVVLVQSSDEWADYLANRK